MRKTAVLDPVESQPANGDYLSAMRENLTDTSSGTQLLVNGHM